MEIECKTTVDSYEFIGSCEKDDLVELCQDVFDNLSDKQKQEFLHDNFDEIETNDIIDLYQDRVIGD